MTGKSLYEEAKAGGEYAKFYERYRGEYLSRLRRASKSYEKVIAEHGEWIRNPSVKLGADAPEEVARRYVDAKWPRDIARNREYKAIIDGIIEERQHGKPD